MRGDEFGWPSPEPTFEEWGNFRPYVGGNLHALDEHGRNIEGSDSDNGKSDAEMEREIAHDRRKQQRQMRENREACEPRAAGSTRGRVKDQKRKKQEIAPSEDVTEEEKKKKKRRTEPEVPQALPPKSPRKKQPLEFVDVEPIDRMQVEEPQAPVAGPSGHNSRPKKRNLLVGSPPPPHRARHSSPPTKVPSEPEQIQLSSESEQEIPAKKPKRASKPTASASSKRPSTGSTSAVARGGGGGGRKGKGKARLSMEQALEEAQKIKVDELKSRFANISSFIDHLSSFELDRPGKLLQGCRILFVNADHWKAGERITRNRLDQGLRLELGIVAKQGGTLVKPEDFVGSPPEATKAEMSEEEIERRAQEEGWTTHVIGFHPSNYRSPTFDEVLGCLGGEEGFKAEDLGPYVKVITFPWVSQCVKERRKQSEWEFAIKGDPRDAPSSRVSSNKSSPRKKSTNDPKERRQGRRKKGPDDEVDTSGESQDEEDDEMAKGAISPFGTQDYPPGERPPTVDQGIAGTGLATVNEDDSDRDGDSNSAGKPFNPMEGLEEQSKLIKELGAEHVDELLEEEAFVIYTGVEDDCETENEEEEEKARREGREFARPDLKEKRDDRKGYAVNREFVKPGHKAGPNDATADVLLQLSEFHKGDPWRERGYRMAAGALRSLKHKMTDYKELIKINSIGAQIAKKIIEINQTGTQRKLNNELPEEKAARLFSGIYGIGLAFGRDLAKRGARTIDDLKKPEYHSILTLDQQVGLKYYEDLLERIPRNEVTELYNIVLEAAREVDPTLQVECMGSYRRGQPNSGDIDILVTRDPTKDGKTHSGAIGKMYKILKSRKFFTHILSQSDDWSDLSCKVNGLCQLPEGKMRRIDILGVPWADMPAALIYFTGNDHFNRSLRLKARHMGYSLNQKCLSKCILRGKGGGKLTEGTRIEVKSEKDIFRILKVPWRRPEERIPS